MCFDSNRAVSIAKIPASQNDQAFITMTGFDCDSCDSLLVKFGPVFDGHTPFDESGMIVEFEYVSRRKRVVQWRIASVLC